MLSLLNPETNYKQNNELNSKGLRSINLCALKKGGTNYEFN